MDHQEYEAVYEGGVFKPVGAVALPEKTRAIVSVPIQPLEPAEQASAQAKVFEILSRRYNSGETDLAARHNEHQP